MLAIEGLRRVMKKKPAAKRPQETASDQFEHETQGFGNWLRSSSGVEYMTLFVLSNFMIVFVTTAWPQIVQAFGIIGSWF